ncbi:sensor histidine kinase [Flavobacterium sp. LB2P84]|uniref:ATP-binding protein n=1 Tax=Flavobacterium yafengii TaxID=3041253 RepID=UPI0024A8BB57|nr:sensor histidine kinase [Flavobacterium yafengii]MDI6033349.1 sensor histidine kinase [Flavobacterium yafengii]
MKTKLKIAVIVHLVLLLVSCQKKKVEVEKRDDIVKLFKKMESNSLKIDEEKKYLEVIYQKLQSAKNDSITRNLYFKLAVKYYDTNSLDRYLNVTRKVHCLSVKDKDSTQIAKSLYYIGEYYEDKTQLDSAFYYYSQSEKIYTSIKDTLNSGRVSLYKAGILYEAGNYTESEIEAIAALRLLSKTSNTRLIYECHNTIAISLKELNNYSKSLEYFRLAIKQLDKLDIENYPQDKIINSRTSCYNNMGRVYEKMGKYQEAIQLYETGLKTRGLKQNYPKLHAMLLNNLGYSKMKSGINDGVDTLFFESLRIRDSLQILPGIVASKIRIGEYYLYKKDTIKALIYLKEGLSLSKKIKSNYDIIQSLKLLTENDSKNKTYYSNLYIKVNDSIQNVERITRNKFARIAYETDQIEEKNEILSKKNTNIILGSGIVIILLGGFFALYRLKSKNKELLFIKEQQEANEKIYQLMLAQQSETEQARNEERNRIAMELHDGIVNSVFTTRFNLIQLESGSPNKKQDLINELEKTEQEIRRVSHDLTQNLLFEDKSLPEILISLVDSQQNQYNTKFDLSVDKYIDWSTVTSANKIHIYRIIQEAIQNSNKYSQAERCFIMLLKTGDKITIRIWDNGIGFNPEKVKYGIGLKNIKDRTKILQGELKITSSSGNGTTLEIVF